MKARRGSCGARPACARHGVEAERPGRAVVPPREAASSRNAHAFACRSISTRRRLSAIACSMPPVLTGGGGRSSSSERLPRFTASHLRLALTRCARGVCSSAVMRYVPSPSKPLAVSSSVRGAGRGRGQTRARLASAQSSAGVCAALDLIVGVTRASSALDAFWCAPVQLAL